jgi:pyridoxal phosphate enzyme (YggS family)
MDTAGLTRVRSEMAAAAERVGVAVEGITLVAVSKGRPYADVVRVGSEGQRIFAENRQQGLAERASGEFPEGTQWHFVGPLQSRKVRFVEHNVSLLHSMDRLSLATKWAGVGGTPVLLQFNIGREPQKSGFDPSAADETIDAVLGTGVEVRGVMAIPPLSADTEMTRLYFRQLRAIFDRYRDSYVGIEHCSMGMSNDYAIAIEEGSTMVRVGRAIFDPTDG